MIKLSLLEQGYSVTPVNWSIPGMLKVKKEQNIVGMFKSFSSELHMNNLIASIETFICSEVIQFPCSRYKLFLKELFKILASDNVNGFFYVTGVTDTDVLACHIDCSKDYRSIQVELFRTDIETVKTLDIKQPSE